MVNLIFYLGVNALICLENFTGKNIEVELKS